jgi:hypothetical protein
MTISRTATVPKHLMAWLAAAFVAQGLLPWTLARAARAAGRRDFVDCHEQARPSALR